MNGGMNWDDVVMSNDDGIILQGKASPVCT